MQLHSKMIYQSDLSSLDSSNHFNVKAKDRFALSLIIKTVFKVKSTIKVRGNAFLVWFEIRSSLWRTRNVSFKLVCWRHCLCGLCLESQNNSGRCNGNLTSVRWWMIYETKSLSLMKIHISWERGEPWWAELCFLPQVWCECWFCSSQSLLSCHPPSPATPRGKPSTNTTFGRQETVQFGE